MATCSCILRSGPRSGEPCAKRARYQGPNGEPLCGIHNKPLAGFNTPPDDDVLFDQVPQVPPRPHRPRNLVITYGPKGASLDDALTQNWNTFDPDWVQPDPAGEEILKNQKNYINVRVGYPVFNGNSFMYVTLPGASDIEFGGPQHEPLTQLTLVKDFAEQVRKFYLNPHENDINDNICLHHLFLHSITFDDNIGSFVANIRTRRDIEFM